MSSRERKWGERELWWWWWRSMRIEATQPKRGTEGSVFPGVILYMASSVENQYIHINKYHFYFLKGGFYKNIYFFLFKKELDFWETWIAVNKDCFFFLGGKSESILKKWKESEKVRGSGEKGRRKFHWNCGEEDKRHCDWSMTWSSYIIYIYVFFFFYNGNVWLQI